MSKFRKSIQFWDNNGFQRYVKNTSWMLIEKLLRMLAGLLVGIWIARYLGPDQFGLFSYSIAFVAIFSSIAKLGLDDIVVRNLVNEPHKRDIYLGTAFWLKVMGALISISIVIFATFFTSNDSTTNLYIFIIASGIVFQSFEVIEFYFHSKVLSKFVSLSKLTQLAVSSVIKIYLVIIQADLFWFVFVSLIDQILLSVTLFIAYKYQKIGKFYQYFDLGLAKKLLEVSWPLIFTSAVLMIQARIDQVMLKEMIGNTEVGYYSVAMRLIEAVAFMPLLLKNSLYPAIQNAKNQSDEMYQHRLVNFYRLNFLLFLLFAIPIYLFSEFIVTTLFGQEYQPAGILLAIMSIRLFFTNMGSARGAYILCENLLKYSLITMIVGTLFNVLFNYILIGKYGATGAIIATIISFFVTIYALDFLYIKTRRNIKFQFLAIFTFFKLSIRY
jgi:O-antigen/teichoic acid export membrane protein